MRVCVCEYERERNERKVGECGRRGQTEETARQAVLGHNKN